MKYAIGGLTRFSDNPADFKTREYDTNVKSSIVKYMESFEPTSVAGYVDDCRTGEPVMVTNAGFEDGEYCWSTQDIYHIKRYNAAVSEEFIAHFMKQA